MAETRPLRDTDDTGLLLMSQLYARMSPAEKLRRMQQLTMATNQLALAGLRSRHPTEGEPQLLLRLARIRLGDEAFENVYGANAPPRGP